MNIIRNMEAVFVVTLGFACSAMYALDARPDGQPQAQARTPLHAQAVQAAQAEPVAATASGAMAVVVVSARRMSEAEKHESIEQERREAEKLATIRSGFRARI